MDGRVDRGANCGHIVSRTHVWQADPLDQELQLSST